MPKRSAKPSAKPAGEKRKLGRPITYDIEYDCRVASAMASLGATDAQLAETLGITEEGLRLRKKRHPELVVALKSKLTADEHVEKSLLQRALGYNTVSTSLTKGPDGERTIKTTIHHVAPHVTAQIFWLKNRQPERWRRGMNGVEGSEGGAVIRMEVDEIVLEAVLDIIRRRCSPMAWPGIAADLRGVLALPANVPDSPKERTDNPEEGIGGPG